MDLELFVSQLEQKKQKLEQLGPLPEALIKNLEEWFRVELTYTSNAIEGNTLTRQETALVIEKGLTVEGKSLKEHLEATNHAEAFHYIKTLLHLKKNSITEKHLLNIHQFILEKIDTLHAGRYRAIPVRIAGSTTLLPNPLKVPNLMKEFISWLKKSKDPIIKIAADTHFKLVSIHPFTDGNGRTARLLMNLVLMQEGYPPAIIRKEDRKNYLNALEEGQTKGNLAPYYHLIYTAIDRSLDIYLETQEPKEIKTQTKNQLLLKIGELSKKTGESISTIRYWTKEGLLKTAALTKGGYQLYDPSTEDQIKKIRTLQKDNRLTIPEIKEKLK